MGEKGPKQQGSLTQDTFPFKRTVLPWMLVEAVMDAVLFKAPTMKVAMSLSLQVGKVLHVQWNSGTGINQVQLGKKVRLWGSLSSPKVNTIDLILVNDLPVEMPWRPAIHPDAYGDGVFIIYQQYSFKLTFRNGEYIYKKLDWQLKWPRTSFCSIMIPYDHGEENWSLKQRKRL